MHVLVLYSVQYRSEGRLILDVFFFMAKSKFRGGEFLCSQKSGFLVSMEYALPCYLFIPSFISSFLLFFLHKYMECHLVPGNILDTGDVEVNCDN